MIVQTFTESSIGDLPLIVSHTSKKPGEVPVMEGKVLLYSIMLVRTFQLCMSQKR